MQNNLEDRNKILELEEKIENLNSDLNEKNFILNQTKEYLFLLQSENEKLNKIKNEYSEELNKFNKLNKDYENRIKVLENKNATLKHDNENLEKEINIMKSTVSWKITKPLRWLKSLLRNH
jgi:chromosome segregation ATPase